MKALANNNNSNGNGSVNSNSLKEWIAPVRKQVFRPNLISIQDIVKSLMNKANLDGFSLLTIIGSPGTGKTTLVQNIIPLFSDIATIFFFDFQTSRLFLQLMQEKHISQLFKQLERSSDRYTMFILDDATYVIERSEARGSASSISSSNGNNYSNNIYGSNKSKKELLALLQYIRHIIKKPTILIMNIHYIKSIPPLLRQAATNIFTQPIPSTIPLYDEYVKKKYTLYAHNLYFTKLYQRVYHYGHLNYTINDLELRWDEARVALVDAFNTALTIHAKREKKDNEVEKAHARVEYILEQLGLDVLSSSDNGIEDNFNNLCR